MKKKMSEMDILTNNRKFKKIQMDWRNKNTSIEINEISDWDADILKFGINWSALGTVTTERAIKFSNDLKECIELVKSMNNEEVKDGK